MSQRLREAIDKAEDRQLFRDCMDELGLNSPKSEVVKTLDEALAALDEIGLPRTHKSNRVWRKK